MGKKQKIQYENILKEDECVQALNEGFVEYFGEENAALFTELASELIPMGKAIGKKFYHISSLLKSGLFSVHFKFAKSEEEKKQMLSELEIFFTKKEIKKISEEKNHDTPHLFQYMKGYGPQQKKCLKILNEENFNKITSKAWLFFKKFPIYAESKSVSLHGEGGLSLDLWNKESIKYFEGELDYRFIERIPNIYLHLGIMLGRQELREEVLLKIISNINENTTYGVKDFMRSYITNVSPGPLEDETLLYIQEKTCLSDDFLTNKQINKKLSKWSNSKEGKQKLKDLMEHFKNPTEN